MQQVNLFECLERYGTFDNWLSAEKNVFNPEDYLRKGERIMSLMREIQHKDVVSPLDCISMSTFQKKTWTSAKVEYAMQRIADVVVRPVLKNVAVSAVPDLSSVLELIPKKWRNEVSLSLCSPDTYEEKLLKAMFRKKNECPVGVVLSIGEQKFLCCLNGKLQKGRHKRAYRLRYAHTFWSFADLGLLLAELILICELLSRLEVIAESGEYGNRINESLDAAWENHKNAYTRNGCLQVSEELSRNEIFQQWQKETGNAYVVSNRRPYMPTDFFIPRYLLTDKEVSLQSFFSPNTMFVLNSTICVMIEEHYRDKQVRRYYAELNHERATVWQTKKNIPEKVIKAMSESGFNDFFGYVEFDEDCELEKLTEIEKEFRALNTILKLEKQENVSLRFRKLGNHKASGLYFPSIHCLCVDIRTPSSMAHEVFHMIDHMSGMLCRKSAFYPIEQAYIRAFEDMVNKEKPDSAVAMQLQGKSKYNREYYLQPMEIFARCGEIYLFRVLGVNNSLCAPQETFAYPDDVELNELVKSYYDKLLKMCKEDVE